VSEKQTQDSKVEEIWREMLTTGEFEHTRRWRRIFKILPRDPRCVGCYAPFQGIGSTIIRVLWGIHSSRLNPRFCNDCEIFAEEYQGGAVVELAMLFADVRGSTSLAENLDPSEFKQLIDRFYNTATQVLVRSDALIEKLMGDEVVALYVPGFAGPNYTGKALEAAQELLTVTGHANQNGPWIPVGVGVHFGSAFVGAVGSKQGVFEITALGDAVNTTSRLAANAGKGEIIVSEEAYSKAGIEFGELEKRELNLKGRSEPVNVRIIRVVPS